MKNSLKSNIDKLMELKQLFEQGILTKEEMEALLDELLTLENPYNCPHGRPTIVSMSKYEIDKKFKRVVE